MEIQKISFLSWKQIQLWSYVTERSSSNSHYDKIRRHSGMDAGMTDNMNA
jgi:hypothetical protein